MIAKAHSNMSFNKLQFIEYLTHDMNFIPNKNNSARAVLIQPSQVFTEK